jgi:hypothetical protein
VQCDTCDRWCHRACAGVPKERMAEEYVCPLCQNV